MPQCEQEKAIIERTPTWVSDNIAWLYAVSFWRAHLDQVLDFLVLSEALDEQENPERN